MNLLNLAKLKILVSALNSVSEKEIVDTIEAFGDKQFGKDSKRYLECVREKVASIIVELGARIRTEGK